MPQMEAMNQSEPLMEMGKMRTAEGGSVAFGGMKYTAYAMKEEPVIKVKPQLTVVKGANSDVAKDVSMQAAAMNPVAVNRDGVPADMVEHEKEMIKAEIKNDPKNASKSDDILDKMATGRLSKFFKENCLVEQDFIKESSMTVEKYVKENGGEVLSMVRFAVGEGIEKKQENFAEEVAAQMNAAN